MKRRITKKGLKDAPWLLADALRLYFARPQDSEAENNEQIGRSLVEVTLMLLIDFRMQLDPLWPDIKRELKKVSLSSISVDNPNVIGGHGETQWTEITDDNKVEVSEPIELKVRVSKSGKPKLDYSIVIGRDEKLREIKGVLKLKG